MRSGWVILYGLWLMVFVRPCGVQVVIKGTVQDSLQRPIPNVNIYATGPDSTSIKAFDYSNQQGQFHLQLKLHQSYLLHVSSLGYGKQIIAIPAASTPDTLVKHITLHPATHHLKELVVKAQKKAIITKKDTIIFNAQAFERGDEENVEDILKQLPGVQVDASGRIKVNGKTVTKVLIGNDDLFGYNYQLLTKNLTAKAIQTVNVYKHYHENEALQGVSHSEETVLDLSLKKSFKVDLFGTAKGYYDLDDHYRANGNAISITKNFKGYLLESANNVGSNPVGNVYQLLQSGSGLAFQSSTKLGSGAGSSPFIGTAPQYVSHLDQDQYLNNQSSLHALSGIYHPTKKLKIKGVGYFLPANRQIDERSETIYDPALGLQNLVEQRNTGKTIRAGLGKVTAKYKPSNKTNLKYEGTFNTFPESDRTNRIHRNQPLQTRLHTNDKVWNQHLRFTHKVTPKNAYRMRVRYKNESTEQNLRINPALSGGPFDSNNPTTPVEQRTTSKGSYVGTDFKYWSKKPNHLFSVRVGGERQGNRLGNRIAGQPDFTNQHHWNRYRAFSSVSYRKTLTPHLKGYARLTGNYVRNFTDVAADVDHHLFYGSPEVGLNYKFGQKQHVQAQYSFNESLPGFKTLYNGQRLTGYQSISQGTNDFILLPANVFTALYQYGNWEDNFVLNGTFNYITSPKNYTTESTITPTYAFNTYRIERDRKMINAGLGLNEFINVLQSNLAFQYNLSSSAFTSYFNNAVNDLRSQTHTFSATFHTAFVGAFNGSGGVDYTLSNTKNNTDSSLRKNRYVSGNLNIFLKIGKKINATAKDKYYHIRQAGDYNFLGFRLKYKLIKDKLTLFLNATNLLDEDSFRTVYLGDYQRSELRNTLNHRYILLGAKLSFK